MNIAGPINTVLSNRSDKAFWSKLSYQYLLGKAFYSLKPNSAVDIMDRDWDTVILLDACRYDTFVECCPDDWPEATKIQTRAGNTWDFYGENFRDAPYPDTVAVTANPRTVRRHGDSFHDIISVFEEDWDDDAGTVRPEIMAQRTIEAHEQYPNKRILSHWIQPHYPFIGSDLLDGYKFGDEPVWDDLMRGELESELVYQAYKETLELALPYVQEVLDEIDGKTVVSSDHGNAFGERPWWFPIPIYGHPRGVRHSSVIEVPWMVSESGQRREVIKGSTTDITADDEEVEDRLEALGYK